MNQGFRQRVIGSLVLLALAVILSPLLFDFSGRPEVDETSLIPTAPAIAPVDYPQPRRPTDIPDSDDSELLLPGEALVQPEPTSLALEASAPGSVSGESGTDEAPSISSDASPSATSQEAAPEPSAEGWVIQVASFSDASRAAALLADLIDDGHAAYRQTRHRGGRDLHLVFVGPVSSRAEAERLQPDIERQYSLQVLVRQLSP